MEKENGKTVEHKGKEKMGKLGCKEQQQQREKPKKATGWEKGELRLTTIVNETVSVPVSKGA